MRMIDCETGSGTGNTGCACLGKDFLMVQNKMVCNNSKNSYFLRKRSPKGGEDASQGDLEKRIGLIAVTI
jgi:hypothetical protein